MKIGKKDAVFKLMDSNGRRHDVVEALNGYLSILEELISEGDFLWKPLKARGTNSLSEYRFYEKALELSSDVFKRHDNYDYIKSQLELAENIELKKAIEANDLEWLSAHASEYEDLYKKIDIAIEARARFYTDTLVTMGFATQDRLITPVGNALIGRLHVKKDRLESLFPISESNIIYLRQLLKLRIFTEDEERYYSPFCLAIYALLRRGRIDSSEFFEMIQGINPNMNIDNWENYVDSYYAGKYWDDLTIETPDELLSRSKLSEESFKSFFTSGKTQESVNIYWEFYKLLYKFNSNRTQDNLDSLILLCEDSSKKDKINKAFGYNRSMFGHKKGQRPSVDQFIEDNATGLFYDDLNKNLYHRFVLSKKTDEFREKADTTRRIFKASGLIKFDNGYVELAYPELCKHVFNESKLRSKFIGRMDEDLNAYYDSYTEYEGDINSFFCRNCSTEEILEYFKEEYDQIIEDIIAEFKGAPFEEIPNIMRIRRNDEFRDFISRKYPVNEVKKILGLFSDRSNDRRIKEKVNPDASVPTIYEYIVGIAWYYFSNKTIDILDSYNMNLSANFEPISFAPGGDGDIVIFEDDKVVMLEVTLMNENAQKRGEWEQVLRHSVNLKVSEEKKEHPRCVTTFFIADVFDANTINIWKAIASVPLQSSADKDIFTDNVVIMPVSSDELILLMDKSSEYDSIIHRVHDLFEIEKVNFDIEWRDKFIDEIL